MKKPVKLSAEIVKPLLERLDDEYTAFAFYRDASNYLRGIGFFTAADYFAKESADELTHAKIIENYIVDWNVHPKLPSVDAQDNGFKGLIDVIEKSYQIEYALYEAYEETTMDIFKKGDTCTFFFLAQFNEFQRKAVAEYSDMLNLLDGVEDEKCDLLLLEEKIFGE
jgi:ferritin